MQIEKLSDNTDTTANSRQLAILKKNFPNCFDKNGAFIPHKMMEIVGKSDLDLSRESYSLNWLGKSYARLLANENPQTLLKEDKEYNAKEENQNSQNLLIRGDNLEVLKHLKNAYSEKIKMIYIDPPYNTGNDGFVYNDDRKFTAGQLSKLAGIELDEAKRILEFTASKSNSHSAWLTFMYPRLYVARELLREDGVIFISIDDNEQAQLKMLCDEVFGEENFVAQLLWKRRASSAMADNNVSSDHEYVLCYQKGKLSGFSGIEKNFENYTNSDNDPKGDWVSGDLTVGMSASMRPNQAYDLVDANTGNIYPCNPNRVWAYIPESMNKLIAEKRIIFPSDPSKRPMLKRFKNDLKSGHNPFPSIMSDFVGLNTEATKLIQNLMGGAYFDYSKPLSLIKTLASQITDKSDLILDFFAGSGTTAHAVMALNAEDGGNRRFITVQIDEPTDPKSEARKAGYETIFDITKARIEKAAIKIKGSETLVSPETDTGFKIFQTTPLFEGYLDEIDDLEEGQTLFNGRDLSDEQLGTLLTTWKTYDGIPLTEDLSPLKFGSYTAYTYGKNVYCMDKDFSSEALRAFIKALDEEATFQPSKLVLFGYNFESRLLREIAEGLKSYKNKKSIELDVVVRY